MSVVLPAPLAPTRPNTAPRGTRRVTPSRAVLGPNRRVSRSTATTSSKASGVMASRLLGDRFQNLVAAADQVEQFVGAEAELTGLGEQGVDALGQDAQPLPPGERGPGVGDVRPGGALLHDDAGDLQLPVGAGDRVRVDDQPL